MSRYHRFKQHDGKGFGILVIDEHDVRQATVLHVNLTRSEADGRIMVLRSGERTAARGVA